MSLNSSKPELHWLAATLRFSNRKWVQKTREAVHASHLTTCMFAWLYESTTQTEVERLQQSGARNSTAIQSLRQQLAEVEEGKGEGTGQRELPELHIEIGRLKTALREKVEEGYQY